MDTTWKNIVWRQFGGAIDMLENAMHACPEKLWSDRTRQPEFWYLVFHTLFWLDLSLTNPEETFAPRPPFTLDELDPAGILPERPYTKEEMQAYLDHSRAKCRGVIETLTEEKAGKWCAHASFQCTFGELLFYNMRHVQHHTGQLNLILRQETDSAPRWVTKAKTALEHMG